jgi:O-antigen/teichoic acid export membrane protein
MYEPVERSSVATAVAPFPLSLRRRLWDSVLSQKRNLQNLSVLVLVNFLIAGVGFITQVKIANTLGKESFGLFAYGLAIATYGAAVIRFGFDRTLVRDLIHYPERVGELVGASLILRWMLFGVVVGAILTWKLAAGTGSGLSWGLLLVITANSMMSMDLQPVYDSWHAMSRHAVYNLIQRCVYFAAIWVIIITAPAKLGLMSIGVATIGSVSFYLILQHGWVMARVELPVARRKVFMTAIELVRGNLTIWLASMSALSFGSLNQLVLKHYRGAAELGGYAAAWQMVSLATMLLYQVARVGNPLTAQITRDGIEWKQRSRFLAKYVCVMIATASPVALAAICLPRTIMTILFRPEYVSASNALRIMGVYMPVFAVGLVASQFLVSTRLEKAYCASVLAGGILSIVACLLFIPRMGANGAAVAMLLSNSVAIGFCWLVVVSKRRETGWRDD